ncbi:MAG: ABC transporter ATP-binding protein [Janthinobacterium lividum]
MNKLPKKLSSFIWHFIINYKWGTVGLCSVSLFWGAQMSITPYFLKVMLDTSEHVTSHYNLIITALMAPALFYFLFSISPLLMFRFYEYVILKTIPLLQRDIWHQMFLYVEQHSLRYFQNHHAGSIANKIADMGRSVEIIYTMITDIFLSHAFALIIAGITLYLVHPIFTVVLAIWSGAFLGLSYWLSQRTRQYSMTLSEARSTVMGKVVDSLANISTVRLFNSYAYESHALSHHLHDTVIKDQRLQWKLLKIKAFQGSTAALFTLVTLGLLVYMRALNKISVGDFALVVVLSQSIIDAVWRLADEVVEFNTALGTAQQALNIIEPDVEIQDAPSAKALHCTHGEILFENVCFSHAPGHQFFENKNIKIEAGQKIALVGFTGSGKTTFVHLILRYFDLNQGRILVDGQDISRVTQASLRESIAMIPQDPLLFHRSIEENICYGSQNATLEEVEKAAKLAHCHEFITGLPDGYQSQVGERGLKLSGGQRQRIAIARAFLKNAPILILDEATAALDAFTEKQIQDSLDILMKNRTTLVITHRLSTLQNMDKILFFDKGHIIEQGNHQSLLQMNGKYAQLWKLQSKGYLPIRRNPVTHLKKLKVV